MKRPERVPPLTPDALLELAAKQRAKAELVIPEGNYGVGELYEKGSTRVVGYRLILENEGLRVTMDFDRLAFSRFATDAATVVARQSTENGGDPRADA